MHMHIHTIFILWISFLAYKNPLFSYFFKLSLPIHIESKRMLNECSVCVVWSFSFSEFVWRMCSFFDTHHHRLMAIWQFEVWINFIVCLVFALFWLSTTNSLLFVNSKSMSWKRCRKKYHFVIVVYANNVSWFGVSLTF